jgi:hypothetical protein
VLQQRLLPVTLVHAPFRRHVGLREYGAFTSYSITALLCTVTRTPCSNTTAQHDRACKQKLLHLLGSSDNFDVIDSNPVAAF